MKLTIRRGQFHQHICTFFSREQDEKHLLANGAQVLRKSCKFIQHTGLTNLSKKSEEISFLGDSIVGEIGRQFFCQAQCASDFLLGKKSLKI